MKWILPALLALVAAPSVSLAEAPVFVIVQDASSVTFSVKASVAIKGRFDKWKSTLSFTSPDVSTGVFDIKVDAASVNTGSGFKNDTLKGDKFFDVKKTPTIEFRSTSIKQTGPNTYSMTGNFTLRGVSKPQTLVLTAVRNGSGGTVKGTMTFDRKDYGMNSGIPFVKIADHVEVTVDLKLNRVSGPPLTSTQ